MNVLVLCGAIPVYVNPEVNGDLGISLGMDIRKVEKAIEENHLEGLVTLSGSFCTGQCNRVGVTVTVDDEVFPGITKESFKDFFNDKILGKIKGGV